MVFNSIELGIASRYHCDWARSAIGVEKIRKITYYEQNVFKIKKREDNFKWTNKGRNICCQDNKHVYRPKYFDQ
ncbi:unnamed protein product [Onchocerca flexuosa]|uniref:Uncharacterized protein n=1 Tax=Onchocerca flexuosa TaxID=387005 RepID=A0A183HXY1_9BILA|nr:unnamed protein product [Onchocerca flexuosa]